MRWIRNLSGNDLHHQARGRVGGQLIAILAVRTTRHALTPIRIFAKRLLIDVDIGVTEVCKIPIHSVAFVLPLLHLFRRQLVPGSRMRDHVHDVLRRFIRRIDDHVAQRACQLGRLLDFLVLEPAMRGDEIEGLETLAG